MAGELEQEVRTLGTDIILLGREVGGQCTGRAMYWAGNVLEGSCTGRVMYWAGSAGQAKHWTADTSGHRMQ